MASVTHPEPAFWLARPNLPVLEIVALLGYRVVIIDMEHGAITQEACDALVAQGHALDLTVIVRVSEARRILVHHKERAASVRAAHSPMAHIIQSTKISSVGERQHVATS